MGKEQFIYNSKAMKNLLLLLLITMLSPVAMMAQSAPAGMRFQAIARDLSGNLLTEKPLIVQVELMTSDSTEKVYYAELHEVSSDVMGVIDFVIGEGNLLSGSFSKIPWATKNMWVRISVKTQGENNFQIISSGQLFSVPYALYATSAGSLAEKENTDGGTRGIPVIDQTSIFWTVDGNANAHKTKGGDAVLGTLDRKDLTMITNNVPRMVIDQAGNTNILLNSDVDATLNVDGKTTMNSVDVTNMMPTNLSGTLQVSKATTLQEKLDVLNGAPTYLYGDLGVNSTLTVKGSALLHGSLDVANNVATHLTGTLTVDKPTTLGGALSVKNQAPTQLTGSLQVGQTMNVDGATSLNNSVDVSGNTHLTGTLVVDKATTLKNSLGVKNISPTQLTGALDVDKTMNVDGTTTLNNSLDVNAMGATHLSGTLVVDKTTILNDLTVDNLAPTQLTGDLDVDKTMNIDGATTLNKTLDVNGGKATHLSGILTLDQAATLKDSLTVSNGAATVLTGSLKVDGEVLVTGNISLDGPLSILNANPSTLTGTLEVAKLPTLKMGLVVKGNGTVGPDGSHLAFFDNTEGGNSDGIAIKIANAHPNKDNNFMTFYRNNTVAGRIEGYQFSDIGSVPAPTSDEIWTAICLGIADYNPLTIAWTQFATAFNTVSYGWNNLSIPAFDIPDVPAFTTPDVPALVIPNVPAFVIPDVPAVDIPDVPGFVTTDISALNVGPYLCVPEIFECPCCVCLDPWNCSCGPAFCTIPSFQLFPGINIPDFPGFAIPNFDGINIPDFPGIDIPDFNGVAIPDFPGIVMPTVPAINLKNLFGSAPTIPTFNQILVSEGVCPNVDIFNINNGYVRRLADWALEYRITDMISLDPLKLVGQALTWGVTQYVMNDGVVYGSKGADYAEYLPKLYASEQFIKGEVVGVYNGKISKNTRNADQVMAITAQPMVLGNMQQGDNAADFEKVAFLGQIPVYVKGPVQVGDFIIPSGKNDGIAVAIPGSAVTPAMLHQVLGNAWDAYDGEGVTLINTSIGLRPREISSMIKNQTSMEDEIQRQVVRQRQQSELLGSDIEMIKQKLGLSANSNNP